MKQMAAEMQQELEATRAELRRGIFELPQETAESAAQMRRVIVDQIEALAELNRIVARHGRSLDTAEPTVRNRRGANPSPHIPARRRGQRRRGPDAAHITSTAQTAPFAATSPAPRRAPAFTGRAAKRRRARNGGWLSDLLTRASREDSPPIAPRAGRATASRGATNARNGASTRSIRSPSTSPA